MVNAQISESPEKSENTESRNLRLRVITPLKTICDIPVSMVIAKTVDGDMGVLYGHESKSALLSDGMLRIFINNKERKEESLMVLGGMITVSKNEVSVMSEIAERPDKLQEFIDKLDTDRATNKVIEQNTDLHTKRIEMAIRKALVRMDVSSYTVLKQHGEEQ